jgi:predicted Zn-dependent protease
LFSVARNDNQLAAVMAHEVGHAIARHGSERISTQMAVQVGLSALSAAGGEQYGQFVYLAAQASTLGIILPFTRNQESEADHIGIILMAKAGYDPRVSVPLWKNFKKAGGSRPPEFLSTHPAPQTRIDRLNALMPQALAIYRQRRPAS